MYAKFKIIIAWTLRYIMRQANSSIKDAKGSSGAQNIAAENDNWMRIDDLQTSSSCPQGNSQVQLSFHILKYYLRENLRQSW